MSIHLLYMYIIYSYRCIHIITCVTTWCHLGVYVQLSIHLSLYSLCMFVQFFLEYIIYRYYYVSIIYTSLTCIVYIYIYIYIYYLLMYRCIHVYLSIYIYIYINGITFVTTCSNLCIYVQLSIHLLPKSLYNILQDLRCIDNTL